jgi:pyridoxine/pyridoxamine 5'-phosphate oxidase
LEVIIKIKEDVNYNIRRILEFRDKWYEYEIMVEKLEFWMKGAEKDLDII